MRLAGGRDMQYNHRMDRRRFLKLLAAGALAPLARPLRLLARPRTGILNDLFWVTGVPEYPFTDPSRPDSHAAVRRLLPLMGGRGLKFYRSPEVGLLTGPFGLIAPDDVVLIKVNAQWKYRGCTNSDLVRGLIRAVLDHPDGFRGEVVIIENGQGRGSLNCDTSASYEGDSSVHANANDESHSFLRLVDSIFADPRVSARLLDPIRGVSCRASDHVTEGYRAFENVSYPCFTTAGGRRVELREGIWTGAGYAQNLKLINVPVLKHHDTGGSEITASLKHFYGVLSMSDGHSSFRHYEGLGETAGKMAAAVRTPVLNIIDAIWVSHLSITGYPASTTFRLNQILASQDPVALDYWAAKHILYPIDQNPRHHPDYPGIAAWLAAARDTINGLGGLADPEGGILVGAPTADEREMLVLSADVNGDGTTDSRDLGIVMSRWGDASFSPADIDQNGVVDLTDFVILSESL